MTLLNIKNFIHEKIPLLSIAKRYMQLKIFGSSYVGLCPFHKETVPSFFINNNLYICYGCGIYGDVISFFSKIMNISYLQQVQPIRYGLQMEPEQVTGDLRMQGLQVQPQR